MPRKTATTCSRILEAAALPLLERAQKLLRLEQTVLQLLPEDLSLHCKVLNLRNKALIVSAPSSAWAARLRFAAPELVRQLRSRYSLDVETLQIRIRPQTPENRPARHAQPKLSMESGNLLAQTAQNIEHRGLQEALFRLAAKARDF
jgi:hypothetical protein